jgi:hypothetical protein
MMGETGTILFTRHVNDTQLYLQNGAVSKALRCLLQTICLVIMAH